VCLPGLVAIGADERSLTRPVPLIFGMSEDVVFGQVRWSGGAVVGGDGASVSSRR
jgi:hypothetical protein